LARIPATTKAFKPRLFITTNVVGIGIEDGFHFIADRPNRFCCICGKVFQSVYDRVPNKLYDLAHQAAGAVERQEWANKHARLHSDKEHENLRASGLLVTPFAAQKLIPYGVIPVQDMVLSDESRQAGLEAARMPTDDAETF